MTAVEVASAAAASGVTSNADVWDAWPVDGRRFGEATTTARRAADDALGASEVGRDWSRRVDEAVHGLDGVDSARLDGWMQAHAESPVPELYEARLVAAWESRTEQDAWPRRSDQADDQAAGQGRDQLNDDVNELGAQHDGSCAQDPLMPARHSAAPAALPAERMPPAPCVIWLDDAEGDVAVDHDTATHLDLDLENFTDEHEDVDSWF